MKIKPIDSAWSELIDAKEIEKLDDTPFLTRCRNGEATREELHYFLHQQFYYSRHFTRYLCALLSNMVNEEDRRELTENLFEEMGLGTLGNISHAQMYRNMMIKLGEVPGTSDINPATNALSEAMLAACMNPNPIRGLGAMCLGAEAIVPHIYSQVVTGFEALGMRSDDLEFFHVHIEGDDAHAITMKQIIDRELKLNSNQASLLRNSARDLFAARRNFSTPSLRKMQ